MERRRRCVENNHRVPKAVCLCVFSCRFDKIWIWLTAMWVLKWSEKETCEEVRFSRFLWGSWRFNTSFLFSLTAVSRRSLPMRFWRFPNAHLQPWRHTVVTRDPRALFPTGRSFGGGTAFFEWSNTQHSMESREYMKILWYFLSSQCNPQDHSRWYFINCFVKFPQCSGQTPRMSGPTKNPSFWVVNCTLRVAPTRHSGRIIPSRSAAGASVRNRAPRHHHAGHRCSCRLPKIPRPGPRAEQ